MWFYRGIGGCMARGGLTGAKWIGPIRPWWSWDWEFHVKLDLGTSGTAVAHGKFGLGWSCVSLLSSIGGIG